jgi:N-acetylglucosamine malate deacetylase 2
MKPKSSNIWRIAVILLCTPLFPALVRAETAKKLLLVVAHPDDEYYFAATVYRMAVQLNTQVDEIIITNGEGGFRYSTLAEPYYKKSLTVEAIGRKELPAIRRKETLNADRILGIKRSLFLNQRDQRFTTDEEAGQNSGWSTVFIISKITALLKKEHYEYIFCILPRATTHGHHQAAAALALQATRNLPEDVRPVLLGFDTSGTDFVSADNLRSPQRWTSRYAYAFDRTRRFGFNDALTYQIVVDWMIAEHKSQGLLQTMCDKDPTEYIWIDLDSTPKAQTAADSLFARLGLTSSSVQKARVN